MTYLPNQPVLRCDLSLQRIIEEFKILAASHTVDSMLPAGPISENTPITINISYSAKYANIGKRTESSFEITLTFKQINQIKNNSASDLMWIRFYTPNESRTPDLNNNQMDGEIYGDSTGHFPHIAEARNWSLKTIKWPVYNKNTGDAYNLRISQSQFEAAKNDINFENGNCYEDTFNIKSYGSSATNSFVEARIENYKDLVNNFRPNESFAPGGMIRLHSCYTQVSEQQAQASSYYLDVPLLRRKNYYYVKNYAPASDTTATHNIDIKMFFEPAYHNDNEARAFSSVGMNLVVLGKDEPQPQTDSELEALFVGQDNDYYPLTKDCSTYFLTIKSMSGTMQYFISGDSLFISNGSEPGFIYFSNIYFDRFFSAGQTWYIQNEGGNTFLDNKRNIDYVPSSDSATETQTELTLKTQFASTYSYYRMYFSEMGEDEVFNNNYVYFKINNYIDVQSLSNSFKAKYLKPIDCKNTDYVPGISSMGTTSDVLLEKANICFITYHKDPNNVLPLDKVNLSYTRLAYNAEKTIHYLKNDTSDDKDIIFKLSAIEYNENNIDRFVYSKLQNYSGGNPIYIAYTFSSSYAYRDLQSGIDYLILRFVFTDSNKNPYYSANDNIFSPVLIKANNIYTFSACRMYISLMPIYMFCFIGFQAPEGVSNIQLNKLYYKRDGVEQEFAYTPNVDVSEAQAYMVGSFMTGTIVYMKPDSVTLKINGATVNLGDSTLYENYTVGLEYSTVGVDPDQQVIGKIGPTPTSSFTNMYEMNDGAPAESNINYICYNLTGGRLFRENALNMIRVSIHTRSQA